MTHRMSAKAIFTHLLGLSLFTAAAAAQPAPGPARPATQAAVPGISADLDDKILPEVNFQNVSLDDAVAYLQETVPHFKAVVFRDPDIALDQPTINIRLKGVSLGQLMQLLASSYPNLEFQPITGAGGTIQLIKVHSPQGIAPGSGAVVKVYALSDVVDRLATRHPEVAKDAAGARKAALDDVLSLIKATLSQSSEGGAAPTLQLHEETQTLIFKGSPTQQNVVEDVLTTLSPKADLNDAAAERDKARREILDLQDRLNQATSQATAREHANSALQLEIERLKVRMEELMSIREREAADRAKEQQRQPAGK